MDSVIGQYQPFDDSGKYILMTRKSISQYMVITCSRTLEHILAHGIRELYVLHNMLHNFASDTIMHALQHFINAVLWKA